MDSKKGRDCPFITSLPDHPSGTEVRGTGRQGISLFSFLFLFLSLRANLEDEENPQCLHGVKRHATEVKMMEFLSLCFSYLMSSFHLSRRFIFLGLFYYVASHKVWVWKNYLAIKAKICKSFHSASPSPLVPPTMDFSQVCYLWCTQGEGSQFPVNSNSDFKQGLNFGPSLLKMPEEETVFYRSLALLLSKSPPNHHT